MVSNGSPIIAQKAARRFCRGTMSCQELLLSFYGGCGSQTIHRARLRPPSGRTFHNTVDEFRTKFFLFAGDGAPDRRGAPSRRKAQTVTQTAPSGRVGRRRRDTEGGRRRATQSIWCATSGDSTVDVDASSNGAFFCNGRLSQSWYGGKHFDAFEDLMEHLEER